MYKQLIFGEHDFKFDFFFFLFGFAHFGSTICSHPHTHIPFILDAGLHVWVCILAHQPGVTHSRRSVNTLELLFCCFFVCLFFSTCFCGACLNLILISRIAMRVHQVHSCAVQHTTEYHDIPVYNSSIMRYGGMCCGVPCGLTLYCDPLSCSPYSRVAG